MMPEKPKSIYESNGIREIREGQTARQCESASDETPALIPESAEESIRMARSARAAEQDWLKELNREYEATSSVLRNASASERDREAVSFLCDEIRGEIELVQGKIAALTKMLEELEQERLVIPEDAYQEGPKPGASEKTGPFDFHRQRRK